MFCPVCGKKQPDNANYCYSCGIKIVIPDETSDDSTIINKRSSNDEKNLKDTNTDSTDEHSATIEKQNDSVSNDDDLQCVIIDENKIECPHCGCLQNKESTICCKCGEPLQRDKEEEPIVQNIDVENTREQRGIGEEIKCPHCGLWQRRDRTICFRCGKSLGTKQLSSHDTESVQTIQYEAQAEHSIIKKNDRYRTLQQEVKDSSIDNWNKQIPYDERRNEIKESKTSKDYSKRGIIFLIVVGIVIVSTCLKINMPTHATFDSEKQMIEKVRGVYSIYEENSFSHETEIKKQLNISEKIIERRYTALIEWHGTSDDEKYYITNWDYKNGIIEAEDQISHDKGFNIATETFVVLSNGKIEREYGNTKETYEKGGKWQSDTEVDKIYRDFMNEVQSRSEKAERALSITVEEVSSNSSYTICTGSIKNNGVKTYKFVEIKGAFKDGSGEVIDTDWTYGVGSEGLEPGESTTFRLSVNKNSNIKSCTVSIIGYN